jgi:hypothetical protein
VRRPILLAVLLLAGCVQRTPSPVDVPPDVARVLLGQTIPDQTLICVEPTALMRLAHPNLPAMLCWGTMQTLRATLLETLRAN